MPIQPENLDPLAFLSLTTPPPDLADYHQNLRNADEMGILEFCFNSKPALLLLSVVCHPPFANDELGARCRDGTSSSDTGICDSSGK